MDTHSIELPRKILIGNNIIEKINETAKELGLKGNVLVLADDNTRKIAGDKIASLLPNSTLELSGPATFQEGNRISEKYPSIDYIVSAGGGRIIDMGKYLAFRRGIPFISVPTAPSHDGITSDRVSFGEKNGHKHSLKAVSPIAIIADMGIISRSPAQLISSGCADVISNCTAVFDWKLARDKAGDHYSDYAASLALLSADYVIKSAKSIQKREEEGMRTLVEALISSGISMSLAGSSSPASGAEHMFSHALDLLGSSGLHGHQCGLGSIITAYLQGQNWRRIRKALITVGSPTTAKGIGIEEDMIIKALLEAPNIRKRYTILDEAGLTAGKAESVCREVGIFKG